MFAQLAGNCTAAAIPLPTISGAEFLSVQASLVQNYSVFIPESSNANHGDIDGQNMSFCNVTLTHTHPGTNSSLTTQVWLPLQPTWNERLQAAGGSGWVAGLHPVIELEMAGAVAEGFATVTLDGGIPSTNDPNDFALISPGHVDLPRLQNFASVSLKDAALAAKSVITSFYGRPAKYSYWSGCSQGGRQGYMLAQRYPELFDGIAAAAPAINFANFFVSSHFPQQVMNEMGVYPHPCELDGLTTAAIQACDGNDGTIDGLISDPDACHFDPFSIVNKTVSCGAYSNVSISKAAATVADAAWNGARRSDGSFLWYAVGYEANLTGPNSIATTTCSSNDTCTGSPVAFFTEWIRLFVEKDPKFSVTNMSREDYQRAFDESISEYDPIIGTSDPNLSAFRAAGGKLITYHGLADTLVSFRNTRYYYDAVASVDANVQDFYRLFESPGLAHCYGGTGGYPSETFNSLVKWVEEGIAPESLQARSSTNTTTILYPYSSKEHE